MRNYYIFSFLLVCFCIVLIKFGFDVAGSPSVQKLVNLDTQREQDFTNLQYDIQDYYNNNNYRLPASLNDLNLTDSKSIQDPESHKSYDYKINSNDSYQLCTTFALASDDKSRKKTGYYDSAEIKHKEGYDCVSFTVPYSGTNLNDNSGSGTVTFIHPTGNEVLCKGTIYTIEWEADNEFKGFTPYLSTPPGQAYAGDTVLLSPYTFLSPSTNGMKNISVGNPGMWRGTFQWKVGDIVTNGQNITIGSGFGYTLSFETSDNQSFDSEPFTISDCSSPNSQISPVQPQYQGIEPTPVPVPGASGGGNSNSGNSSPRVQYECVGNSCPR